MRGAALEVVLGLDSVCIWPPPPAVGLSRVGEVGRIGVYDPRLERLEETPAEAPPEPSAGLLAEIVYGLRVRRTGPPVDARAESSASASSP